MIFNWQNLSVWLYDEPIDMRRSFEFLSNVVGEKFSHSVVDGSVYLFFGHNRRRAKILYFDGTGLVLVTKRLEKGMFQSLASIGTNSGSISIADLKLLFAGSHINFRMDVSKIR